MSFMESTFLFVISGVLSSLVITNAYYQKQQFYPSVVYITKSNASMGVCFKYFKKIEKYFNLFRFDFDFDSKKNLDNISTRFNTCYIDW